MKQTAMLTMASLLTILLMTIHMTGDSGRDARLTYSFSESFL